MSSTAQPSPTAGRRSRGSARGGARTAARSQREEETTDREEQYDLLTAAMIGLAIGAGAALLLRRGPSGDRPIIPAAKAVGRGARIAAKRGVEGARWAAERGEELWDRVPREEIADTLGGYLETARKAIDETVEDELKDLRRAIRRQRKRLGI